MNLSIGEALQLRRQSLLSPLQPRQFSLIDSLAQPDGGILSACLRKKSPPIPGIRYRGDLSFCGFTEEALRGYFLGNALFQISMVLNLGIQPSDSNLPSRASSRPCSTHH